MAADHDIDDGLGTPELAADVITREGLVGQLQANKLEKRPGEQLTLPVTATEIQQPSEELGVEYFIGSDLEEAECVEVARRDRVVPSLFERRQKSFHPLATLASRQRFGCRPIFRLWGRPGEDAEEGFHTLQPFDPPLGAEVIERGDEFKDGL
jgi:hypothetical protein